MCVSVYVCVCTSSTDLCVPVWLAGPAPGVEAELRLLIGRLLSANSGTARSGTAAAGGEAEPEGEGGSTESYGLALGSGALADPTRSAVFVQGERLMWVGPHMPSVLMPSVRALPLCRY